MRIDPNQNMTAKKYSMSLLAFSLVCFIGLYYFKTYFYLILKVTMVSI